MSAAEASPEPRAYRGLELLGEAADEEAAARIAAEIASPGVELREEGEGGVAYRIYLPEGFEPSLAQRVRALWRTYTGREPHALRPFEARERDWETATRAGFTGTETGPFWIGPPWVEPPPRSRAIRINPGRAFGTGLHATTRIALRLLLPRVVPAVRVLDVGTGSGVLALAALALGAANVTALDVDLDALLNARGNASLNAFDGELRLVAGSVDAIAPGGHAFDLILANLEHETLTALLPRLVSALAPDGQLAVCGFTPGQRHSFLEAARRVGLEPVEEMEEEGWWGAILAGG